jgi:ubiquinol-cytochrome c reductase cytochrome c subunit
MTKHQGWFGLALLVAGLFAAAGTGEGAPDPTPQPTTTPLVGNARTGQATFTEYCSICHGTAGQGFIGPHIGGIDWTVPGLHSIVRGGLGGYGGMPAFNADAVTDQNIADIAAYLASLATATPSATALPSPSPAPPALATPMPAAHAPSAAPVPTAIATIAADLVHGRAIFMANCAACHGASGGGGVGPSLHGEASRKTTAAAIAWIKKPKLPMPTLYPNPLSEKDVDDVAAYIESL